MKQLLVVYFDIFLMFYRATNAIKTPQYFHRIFYASFNIEQKKKKV